MFDVPDQVVPASNIAKNPAPTGFAQVRLHNTAEIAVGMALVPNVPVTVMSRVTPLPNAPPPLRES